MKRNIFAVCDLEVDYALNFMDYMNRKKNIPFEIQAFTSVENLIAYGKQTHIELLLISGRAMCREVRDLDIGKIIILSEGVHPPELDQYPSVYKYQSSSDVLREVMACYGAEKKTVADQIAVLKKTTEIIGIFSPLGRCLKTSFALTLGQILAKDRAVLYLNLEEYAGFDVLMNRQFDGDISDLMYSNRDKRMDATIVRDKTEWQKEYIETNMGGSASQGIRSKEDGGWYTTTTGYYWRKYTVLVDPRVYVSNKINFHYVIARLGEMYMNLAEAYLLKGDVANAVTALNATRVKHGGLPASQASTLEEAWKDYIRERRVEMAYEEADIYFSYLRWGKYGSYSNYGRNAGDVIKDLNAPVYKISISSDRKSACIGQLTLLNSWNRKFTTKRYLFPIPQGQIDTRTAAGIIDKQNEGW